MTRVPILLEHPSSLIHETGEHPERVERIVAASQALDAPGETGWQRVQSPAASREQLRAVHAPDYVAFVEEACLRGGAQLDPDTFVSPGSFEAASHAAGGAAAAVDAVLGGARSAFSLHRPPGHHALTDRAMGFCLFNSVAVAARHAIDAHGLSRVMIVDFDVHHGNGTEAIFWDNPQVLFVSIHQSPLWPGSGAAGDLGGGPGLGHNVNLPVRPGSGDAEFTAMMGGVVLPLLETWEPQLVLISAGFDAHRDDPLAGCEMSDAGYGELSGMLRFACDRAGVPLAGVLEGGYDLGALSRSLLVTLKALESDGQPFDGGDTPDVIAARRRLVPFWPAMGRPPA